MRNNTRQVWGGKNSNSYKDESILLFTQEVGIQQDDNKR